MQAVFVAMFVAFDKHQIIIVDVAFHQTEGIQGKRWLVVVFLTGEEVAVRCLWWMM